MRASVAVLKRVCRQRTIIAWKDWRATVEEHKGKVLKVCVLLSFIYPMFVGRQATS